MKKTNAIALILLSINYFHQIAFCTLGDEAQKGDIGAVLQKLNTAIATKDKNRITNDFITSYARAAKGGQLELIKEIYEKFPQQKELLNNKDKNNLTPLLYASREKKIEAISFLLEKGAVFENFDPYSHDSAENNAIDYIISNDLWNTIKNSFKRAAEKHVESRKAKFPELSKTELATASAPKVHATQEDKINTINKYLKEEKIDIALSRAISGRLPELAIKAVNQGAATSGKKSKDAEGRSPLIRAAQNGLIDIVKLLLEGRKADPNDTAKPEWASEGTGGKHRTALHSVLRMTKGTLEKAGVYHDKDLTIKIIHLLMKHGADPYIKDCPWGLTIADWTAANPEHSDILDAIIESRHKQLKKEYSRHDVPNKRNPSCERVDNLVPKAGKSYAKNSVFNAQKSSKIIAKNKFLAKEKLLSMKAFTN